MMLRTPGPPLAGGLHRAVAGIAGAGELPGWDDGGGVHLARAYARGSRMNEGARSAGSWLLRWVAATAAVGTAWVVVTLAQGGRVHRTGPSCPGTPDANVIAVMVMSAALAAPLVAVWWSVATARAARGRHPWLAARLALAAAAVVVLAVVAVLPGVCSGGPPH